MPARATLDKIFAANRAAGHIALDVAVTGGVTRRKRVAEDGPLRVRFPGAVTNALETVIVNTGGGIVGGDSHVFKIAVGEGAQLNVTSAAAEKVYRSLGPDAEIDIRIDVGAGARLAWLPQETILFDRSRLSRRIEVDLAEGASLLLGEAVVFGRSAMGETVHEGAFRDCWRVRRGGRLVFAETVRPDGPIARRLAEPAVLQAGAAIATVLAVPGDEASIEGVRELADGFSGEVAISAWNGLAVARLCAKDGAALRGDLAAVVTALGGALPRLWLS